MAGGIRAPRRKKYSKRWYKALFAKKRHGPTAPQISDVLKCVREKGQVKPLTASAVQMCGMCVRA